MKKSKILAFIISLGVTSSFNLNVSAELSQQQESCPDYLQISSERLDMKNFEKTIDELEKMAENPDNVTEQEVVEKAEILVCEFVHLSTINSIEEVEFNKNTQNKAASEKFTKSNAAYTKSIGKIGDCITALCDAGFTDTLRDILGYDLVNIFTYIDSDYAYEENDDENEKLIIEVNDLINEYMSYSDEDFTAEYDGRTWNASTIFDMESSYSEDEIANVAKEIKRKKNETLGNIFLEIVKKRDKIAKNSGYDDYAQYAGDCLYLRDYSSDDLDAVYETVKKDFCDVYLNCYDAILSELGDSGLLYKQFDEDEIITAASEFLSEFNGDYEENLNHMVSRNLYDIRSSEKKSGESFSISISDYSVSFLFMTPTGGFDDMLTFMHEFGHSNAEYTVPTSALYEVFGNSIDTAEIHSQGMEVMFALSESSIYSEDEQKANMKYVIYNLMNAIVEGCLYDEFQKYAYENPDCTLGELNDEFAVLCKEYGIEYSEDDYYSYDWVEITHNYNAPMYYISYATSAASALDLWLKAMENPDNAKEIYDDIVNCGIYVPYIEAAEGSGLATIFDEQELNEIAYQIEYYFENEKIDSNYETAAIESKNDVSKAEKKSETKMIKNNKSESKKEIGRSIVVRKIVIPLTIVAVVIIVALAARRRRKKDFNAK